MAAKVSPSQKQALEDIRDYGCPWRRVRGQSQHGGWHSVMLVLEYKQKWAWYRPTRQGKPGRWLLTEAGKIALAGA